MSRIPSRDELVVLYAGHDKVISELSAKAAITEHDLTQLDRIGRFRVVVELWERCDEAAQLALLNDRHWPGQNNEQRTATSSPR